MRAMQNARCPPPLVRQSWEEFSAPSAGGRSGDSGGASVAGSPFGAGGVGPPHLFRKRSTGCLEEVILKFTTLSNDSSRKGFRVRSPGATVGRSASNAIPVPSDGTMRDAAHGFAFNSGLPHFV